MLYAFTRLHMAIVRDVEKTRATDPALAEEIEAMAAAHYGISRQSLHSLTDVFRRAERQILQMSTERQDYIERCRRRSHSPDVELLAEFEIKRLAILTSSFDEACDAMAPTDWKQLEKYLTTVFRSQVSEGLPPIRKAH